MNEMFMLILSLVAGILLGIFYFGGLWLTVKNLPVSRNPYILTLGSFFGRTVISLIGFYMVARGGNWERLLVCVAGFIFMKIFLVYRLRPEKREAKLPGKIAAVSQVK
ncbi:MAG: ATP synthase subunit I [Candidatus Methanoperedens sp.]|nr:ATP synthase subunit I [Candidatus Methanoperedens sp.]